jgi:Spy/CpxP family protein refolding chaperone
MESRYIFTTLIGVFLFAVAAAATVAQPQQRLSAAGGSPEQRTQRLKDSLALSDSQAVQILAIFQDNDVKRAELFESNSGDRDAMRESMRILARETDAKIEAILTPEQNEKYQVLRKQWQERRGEMRRRVE